MTHSYKAFRLPCGKQNFSCFKTGFPCLREERFKEGGESLLRREETLDLFKRDKHDDVPATKAHEVCSEALVERERTFLGDHVANHGRHTLVA